MKERNSGFRNESSNTKRTGLFQRITAAFPASLGKSVPNAWQSLVELQTLVREQLRHYCERGCPRYFTYSEERHGLYERAAGNIISSLEIGETISEHGDWINHLKTHPNTLDGLYRDYRLVK